MTIDQARLAVTAAMRELRGGKGRHLDTMLRGRYKKVKPHNSRPQRERCAGAKWGSEASCEQLTDWRALTWEMDLMAVKRPQTRDGAPPDERRMQDYVQYKTLIDQADAQYDTLLLRGDPQRRGGRPKGSKDKRGRAIKNRLAPIMVV